MSRFLLGINYWPRSSAMYMWQRFNIEEIGNDIARIKELGLDVVRFFLMWEAFQPEHNAMDPQALRRFDAIMEKIAAAGLRAMPTLFCGHMSGVNWLPAWTLEREPTQGRFRTIAGGNVVDRSIGDFYADPDLMQAQLLCAPYRRASSRQSGDPCVGSRQRVFEPARARYGERRRRVEQAVDRRADRNLGCTGHGRHAR